MRWSLHSRHPERLRYGRSNEWRRRMMAYPECLHRLHGMMGNRLEVASVWREEPDRRSHMSHRMMSTVLAALGAHSRRLNLIRMAPVE